MVKSRYCMQINFATRTQLDESMPCDGDRAMQPQPIRELHAKPMRPSDALGNEVAFHPGRQGDWLD